MKNKIIIGLSVFFTTALVAAIVAPTAVLVSHDKKMTSINNTLVKEIRLTETGVDFFNDQTFIGVAPIQNAVNLKTKDERKALIQAFNGNGDPIDAIALVESFTIKGDAHTKMFKANLELTWNSGFEVPSNDVMEIELRKFDEITLHFGEQASMKGWIQSFIWNTNQTFTNQAQLNNFFQEIANKINGEVNNGFSFEQTLYMYNIIDFPTSVENISFEVTKFENNLFSIEISFTEKDNLKVSNLTNLLEDISIVEPTDEPIFMMSDAKIKEWIENHMLKLDFYSPLSLQFQLIYVKPILSEIVANHSLFTNDDWSLYVPNPIRNGKFYDVTLFLAIDIPESKETLTIKKDFINLKDRR